MSWVDSVKSYTEQKMASAKAFGRGFRGEHLSLEEALTHGNAERQLIKLDAPGVTYTPFDPERPYDLAGHTVQYEREIMGEKRPCTVILNRNFKDYMRKYGHKTHYVTDNGTPWLTHDQEMGEIDPEQARAYYEALCHTPTEEQMFAEKRNQAINIVSRTSGTVRFTDNVLRSNDMGHNDDAEHTPKEFRRIVVMPDEGEPEIHLLPLEANIHVEEGDRVEEGALLSTSNYTPSYTGPDNDNVVLVSWRNTDFYKFSRRDSGHSAISSGVLNKVPNEDGDGFRYHYDPEITGSFYPTTGPLFFPEKFFLSLLGENMPPAVRNYIQHYEVNNGHFATAAQERLGEHSVSHTAGVMARDSVKPIAAAAGTMLAYTLTEKMMRTMKDHQEGKIGNEAVQQAIKAMALMAAGYMAAKATATLDSATGTVLMKEEYRASGVLACLVTPAQLDIMQHAMYGMYKTYHERYNILGLNSGHNCADYSDQMMKLIGVDIARTLGVVEEQQKENQKAEMHPVKAKLANAWETVSIPNSKRPSRLRDLKNVLPNRQPKTGEIEVDGQPLTLSLMKLNDRSAVLIESSEHLFGDAPIETFQKVLEKGLTLRANQHGRFQFELEDEVKQVPPTRAATAIAR